jgi:hypothetical protein
MMKQPDAMLGGWAAQIIKDKDMIRLNCLKLESLSQAKEAIARQEAHVLKAYEELLRQAAPFLSVDRYSVVDKRVTPPSGDKHDLMTFSGYAWPDPANFDAVWRARDGVVNPLKDTNDFDTARLNAFSFAIETLALAYFFTKDEKWVGKAIDLIRAWFKHPETRMNPNADYAGVIPGRTDKPASVVTLTKFLRVVDSIGLLKSSQVWTDDDEQAVMKWFKDLLEWLQGEVGRKETRYKNNRGLWYDCQVACYAFFVGKDELARSAIESSKPRMEEIDSDGSQGVEIRRTKGFIYSWFTLHAWMSLASVGKQLGIDLWNYKNSKGGSILKAMDFLAPYADPKNHWPFPTIVEVDPVDLYPFLANAYDVTREQKYLNWIRQIPEDCSLKARARLGSFFFQFDEQVYVSGRHPSLT